MVAPEGSGFSDDDRMTKYAIPTIPASAGALIGDGAGRILILEPTYKSGWTVPGGQIEADGESPWDGCRREVLEETGLTVHTGQLVCVDFLRPRPGRPGGLRFLFDCGSIGPDGQQDIVLQSEEIRSHRWAGPDEAGRLLSGPVGRRVGQARVAGATVYLEDGRPVPGVSA
jgi:8-oxo-dGTP diphosphatase